MEKIYYNSYGFVCLRYPHNYPIENVNNFIEVEKENFEKTLFCPVGYIWSVSNNQLQLVLDSDEQETKKRLELEKNNAIAKYKSYLSETDYVISKLNELKLEDEEEYNIAKQQYVEVLQKRKEARNKINELEGDNN